MASNNLWMRVRNRCKLTLSRRFGRRSVLMRNKVPIISFTFDDFPISAYRVGGAILKEHGARGTFYTSLGLMGTNAPVGQIFSKEDLAGVLSDGHELGSHTFGHCHSWDTAPSEFEKSIVENESALRELFPSASFKSLSYPITEPRPGTKSRTGRHFVCSRGGGQTLNQGTTDLNCLRAFFLEKSTDHRARISALIAECVRSAGWLIFATHDVCESPTRFGITPAFFSNVVEESVRSGATILPVWDACQLVAGRPGNPSSKS